MGPARGRGTEGADSNPHREAKRPSPIARHLLFPTHRQSALGDFRSIPPSGAASPDERSEEHTSELQSLMRISYAVFCLTKKKTIISNIKHITTTQILH